VAWTIYGLITSQFGDVTTDLQVLGSTHPQTVKAFIESYFGFKHSFLSIVALMMPAFSILFAVVFILGIKFLNFQHR
jgi:hypothetical protein